MCEDPVYHVHEDAYYLHLKGVKATPRKMVPDGPVVKTIMLSKILNLMSLTVNITIKSKTDVKKGIIENLPRYSVPSVLEYPTQMSPILGDWLATPHSNFTHASVRGLLTSHFHNWQKDRAGKMSY